MTGAPPLLELQSLAKRYGSVVVADSVSLRIPEGACFGLVGPNGAGKTSLFHMITGTVKPNAGRVLFQGRDITDADLEAIVEGLARGERVERLVLAPADFEMPKALKALEAAENKRV